MANADEVLAELRKFEKAEAQRYADLASRVQGLIDSEAGRYADYVRRFNAIMAALPKGAAVADSTEPAPQPGPGTPADPANPTDPGSTRNT